MIKKLGLSLKTRSPLLLPKTGGFRLSTTSNYLGAATESINESSLENHFTPTFL